MGTGHSPHWPSPQPPQLLHWPSVWQTVLSLSQDQTPSTQGICEARKERDRGDKDRQTGGSLPGMGRNVQRPHTLDSRYKKQLPGIEGNEAVAHIQNEGTGRFPKWHKLS